MRTVEEIKGDIERCKHAIELEQTAIAEPSSWPPKSSFEQVYRMFSGELICYENELMLAITSGIPLSRLEEIMAAERDGRCVVLPCKVGTDVYRLDNAGTRKKPRYEICKYTIDHFTKGEDLSFTLFGEDDISCLSLWDIGKTVFLSYEAAQAALKGGR